MKSSPGSSFLHEHIDHRPSIVFEYLPLKILNSDILPILNIKEVQMLTFVSFLPSIHVTLNGVVIRDSRLHFSGLSVL